MKEGGSGNKKVEWGQLERKKRGEGGRKRENKQEWHRRMGDGSHGGQIIKHYVNFKNQ